MDRRKENLLLLALAAINFTHIIDFVIMMPLGPQLMRLFSISPREFGLLVSSYTFSAAIVGFLGAFLIDRFDRKRALLVLYAGFIGGTSLCAFAPSFWFLVAARVVAGAFGGIMGATVLAMVGDAFPAERRGVATGTVMAAFSLASIAGLPLGLWLAAREGWQSPFKALALLCLAVWLLAWRAIPDMSEMRHYGEPEGQGVFRKATALEVMKEVLTYGNHQRAFALMIALNFAAFLVIPYIGPYMVSNVGMLETQLPLIYLCGGSCTLFTSRFFGKLSDRRGKLQVFTVAAAISILPTLLLTCLPRVAIVWALLANVIYMISMNSRFVPAMAMITSSVKPRLRGSFMSVNSSMQQLSSGTASLVAGFMIGEASGGTLTHYGWVGALSGAVTVAAIFLARRLRVEG
jgi:predicted MFS family arabinose efflux permease